MTKECKLFSVIIPTRNRYQYLDSVVQSITQYTPDAEIVISDTSDTENPPPQLRKLIDEAKCIYKYSGPGKSVTDNFNLAFQLSTGKYFTFIGDDDLIGPQIMEVVRFAEKSHVEAIMTTLPIWYYWPDFKSTLTGDLFSGRITFNEYSGKVEQIDARKELSKALKSLGYGPGSMPRAYLGIISRELAVRIVNKYGSLFGSVSPDIFSSALISYESRNTIKVDLPIIIPGSSGLSTSGLSAQRKHQGDLYDNPHLKPFKDKIQWNPTVPAMYSVPTVWAYTLLEATKKINDPNLQPNYMTLYVRLIKYLREYRRYIQPAFKEVLKKTQVSKIPQNLIVSLGIVSKYITLKLQGKIFLLRDILNKNHAIFANNAEIATEKIFEYSSSQSPSKSLSFN